MYIFQIYTYKFFIYTYKFITRGVHGIYTPAIEQSDWSECTSHGTNVHIQPVYVQCICTMYIYLFSVVKLEREVRYNKLVGS